MAILVTGATGAVGREVVRQLVARGEDVVAISRDPESAGLPGRVVRGDLTRPEEVPLDGVTALFLLAPLSSGNGVELAKTLVERACEAERVVFLSSDAVTRRRLGSYEGHRAVEEVVEASGKAWTHLRPGEFMGNKLVWAPTIRAHGVVRSAFPDSVGVPVHEADIAEVAVLALTGDHGGRVYTLSGPERLSLREQAAAIGTGLGRPIGFEAVTYREARASLIADAGLPYEIAEYLLGYQVQYEQEPPEVEPAFEEVTGRRGRTLAQWAADHAAELG
ncbi:NAD(P)H-binding protein [Actinosynnema sp. NPDC020468]|uniref:NAD(P)H-binding protein n=1 Tax=Actinosynnema sp. NPDC020468 TaxID=3154488 RepID=UPI0033E356A8